LGTWNLLNKYAPPATAIITNIPTKIRTGVNPFCFTKISLACYNNNMQDKALKPIDLTKKLLPYENKWVALSEDKKEILGSGNTLKEAKKSAEKGGKKYLFLKVLPFDTAFVPASQ